MLQHPTIYQYLVKIDNEGKRTVGMHVLSKRMGLHKGASDLFLAFPINKYNGLWMEIKPDGWRPPTGKKAKMHIDNQKYFLEKMNDVGYFTSFVVGVDEGINAFKAYLKDLTYPKAA